MVGSCLLLGRAFELCQLCGWALWLDLVFLLVAPLNSVNSVAGLCGWALSSSCPPLGRAPECVNSVAGRKRAYNQPRRFDSPEAEIEPRWTLH